jgi:alpha-L-fucosidase
MRMNKKRVLMLAVALWIITGSNAQPVSKMPLPSQAQLGWHNMEYYWFVHFSPNTFTDREWGLGDEPEDAFNPTDLDCRQWCRIAKAAGAKGIIITAKHHDGFCLWPSNYSTHTVRESKWKNGKGDVLKELSQACKEYGLKFGVYLSPWDRNHPQYGTPAYNDVFVNMMKEIFTNYGPIWEFWWDGANGEGPNGKRQVYDWHRFEQTIRILSPNTVVFSDIGPDIRWVGNESGVAGKTNWNYLDTAGFTRGSGAPSTDVLNTGNENGNNWIPAECDVSIRPGWFYHPEEDAKVKTPAALFSIYLQSVGRGATMLLNVPADRRGLIHAQDSAAVMGFKKLREENFHNNLAAKAKVEILNGKTTRRSKKLTDNLQTTAEQLRQYQSQIIRIDLPAEEWVNCIVLQEDLTKGQRVKEAEIGLFEAPASMATWQPTVKATTIGHKRILTFPAQKAKYIYIRITAAKASPFISEAGVYYIDESLVEQ